MKELNEVDVFFNTAKERDKYHEQLNPEKAIDLEAIVKRRERSFEIAKDDFEAKEKQKTGPKAIAKGEILDLNYKNDYSKVKHLPRYGNGLSKSLRGTVFKMRGL